MSEWMNKIFSLRQNKDTSVIAGNNVLSFLGSAITKRVNHNTHPISSKNIMIWNILSFFINSFVSF